jgi:hypothetical protein
MPADRARNGARLSRDRAEILRLITELTARGAARAERERRRREPSLDERRARERSDGDLLTRLQSVEKRLNGLEARMSQRRSSRPSPPANGDGEPGADATTFSGLIQGQMLSDMLQLVSSNDLSGEFVVESDGRRCHLFFQLGRICHAHAPGLVGEEAFFAAFAAESGKYWFIESSEPPPEKTIDSNTQFLILEALRRIDESRA